MIKSHSMNDDRYEYYGDIKQKSGCLKAFLFFCIAIGVNYFLFSCDDIIQEPPVDSLIYQIPTVSLKTDTVVYSKDIYVKGSFQVQGDTSVYTMQIKGRGNSTWGQPKNPYKIKFDSKVSLFGIPSDKEYALLANYFDKTLIRNDVAFELSERLEMAWTPRRQLLDIYLNGNFQGNYLLTETVKIGKDRLNVILMDAKKQNDTANSFLVEADQREDALQHWVTSGIKLSMKDPDSVSAKQLAYVKRQFQKITDNMNAGEDMRKTLDMDSWIKWILVNELMRNRDATLGGSCYFYKDSTGKIAMGPVWDFDLSSGAYEGSVPTGWYVHNASWIGFLFNNAPYYRPRMKEIWNQYRDTLQSISKYIDDKAETLNKSQAENYKVWDINKSVYEGQIIGGDYKNYVSTFKDFMIARFNWMDSEIQKF